MPNEVSDDGLRMNHKFVTKFETLRKRFGYWEMSDSALRDIARETGGSFEDLRIARHLRNALAHGQTVNRDRLARVLRILCDLLTRERAPAAPPRQPVADKVLAYRIHAWKDPRLEQEMIANGFVSVGGAEIGNLTDVTDPEEIRARLATTMPESSEQAIALYVGYWRRFLWEAEVGHIVVLPTRDRRAAIGEFTGPYHYVDDTRPRARHRRPVYWGTTGIDRSAFGPDLVKVLNGRHTVQEFKADGAVRRLRAIAATGRDPGPGGQ